MNLQRVFPSGVQLGLVALGFALQPSAVSAQSQMDPPDVTQVQATTQALIDTLVEAGVITRQKADEMVAKARARADAGRSAAGGAEAVKEGRRVVRVPYVPESTKAEIRAQIRQEVVEQARAERWGVPNALPEWTKRFKFSGDMRLRRESIILDPSNTRAGIDYLAGGLTRTADLLPSSSGKPSSFNTQDDYDRLRVRARLGVTATVNDHVQAGLRITTGNTSDRTSTNQTIGQNFNKYTLVLDHAFLKVSPVKGLDLTGGRMPNPFMSTDLVWADDLGFEGVVAQYRHDLAAEQKVFFTAGWFPITVGVPGSSRSRSMIGLQAGAEGLLPRSDAKYRVGVGYYGFQGLTGRAEDTQSFLTRPDYLTRYEYAQGLRQRGNTLFRINAPTDTASPGTFGLASDFRELNVTASLDVPSLLPVPMNITADFVKNLAFDAQEMAERAGAGAGDGHDTGFMLRVTLGQTVPTRSGDWNAWLAYRYLGSDAVLDAFTNADFGLGGTNNKGFMLGGSYAPYDSTWVTVRWMSSDVIDSMAPGSQSKTKLSVDTVQVDLNARF